MASRPRSRCNGAPGRSGCAASSARSAPARTARRIAGRAPPGDSTYPPPRRIPWSAMAIVSDLVVDVRGPGRERGRMHGEALRDRITAGLERWDADVAARLRVAPAEHVARLLAETRFPETIKRHTPALLDEVRGIAEGAGAAFERVLAYNLMDEEWWFSRSPSGRQACSVVAVAP